MRRWTDTVITGETSTEQVAENEQRSPTVLIKKNKGPQNIILLVEMCMSKQRLLEEKNIEVHIIPSAPVSGVASLKVALYLVAEFEWKDHSKIYE